MNTRDKDPSAESLKQATRSNIAMKLIGTPACTRLRRGNPTRQQLIATLNGLIRTLRVPDRGREVSFVAWLG